MLAVIFCFWSVKITSSLSKNFQTSLFMKTTFLILLSCLGVYSAVAQKWSYDQFKPEGQYIAEVYAINSMGDQTDTALQEVVSFNEQLKVVDEVEESGLKSRKAYNPDGTVKSVTDYSYEDKIAHSRKTEFQYKNGLAIAATSYELINDKWQKTDTRYTKYQFNKKGQVIKSSYSNENGAVYHDAFMVYDPNLKPKQLYYYDEYQNLMLPGCIEKKVVIENTVHHFDLYQYDSAANIVQYRMTHEDKTPSYQYYYSYNDKGQLIAYDYFNGNNFDRRYVFEYLPNGLPAAIKTFSDQAQTQVREILLYKYL